MGEPARRNRRDIACIRSLRTGSCRAHRSSSVHLSTSHRSSSVHLSTLASISCPLPSDCIFALLKLAVGNNLLSVGVEPTRGQCRSIHHRSRTCICLRALRSEGMCSRTNSRSWTIDRLALAWPVEAPACALQRKSQRESLRTCTEAQAGRGLSFS